MGGVHGQNETPLSACKVMVMLASLPCFSAAIIRIDKGPEESTVVNDKPQVSRELDPDEEKFWLRKMRGEQSFSMPPTPPPPLKCPTGERKEVENQCFFTGKTDLRDFHKNTRHLVPEIRW